MLQRVAVLTSGGDAPGMNAALRAVVRSGLSRGWEMVGVRDGYAGLLAGAWRPLGARDVGGIIQQGGTVLGSARSPEFRTAEGQAAALVRLREAGIGALVVIGGDGSLAGAHALGQRGLAVVGIGATIDNDLFGTESALGVDTALNVALEAMDRLRTTAASHRRAFLLEVMGRECGYLALMTAIAGGAEAVVLPEVPGGTVEVLEELRAAWRRGKSHALVVVAEGATPDAASLAAYAAAHPEEVGFDVRLTVLGHVQRGGAPTAADRLLGSRLGAAAVAELARGASGVLVGVQQGEIVPTPLDQVVGRKRPLEAAALKLAAVLAR